jgi:hypothetical protein
MTRTCHSSDPFLTFTPNREWHSPPYSVLVVLSIFYPPEERSVRFGYICELLRRLSQNRFESSDSVAFLVRSVDADLTAAIESRSEFSEAPCLSDPQICEHFQNLDYGYRVLNGVFSYDSGHPSRRFSVIYTNVHQTDYDPKWLREVHQTPIGNRTFPGYYSAACASFVVFSARFRILDYFDFYTKLDLDSPLEQNERLYYSEFFPMRQMAAKKAFVFGCKVMLDSAFISQNVFKMMRAFLAGLTNECGREIKSESLVKGYLRDQRQEIPGIFQQFWLGFFGSPEVKAFTESWFGFPEGHRIHRWGDQQWTFLVHALFAKNASQTLMIDLETAGCTWYRFPPVW